MKTKARMCVVVSALVLMVTGGAFAQTAKDAGKPGVVDIEVVAFEATVTAIDSQKRAITLKGPEGATKTFTVGNEVRNFDQIKPGDKVKIESIEETALFVRKASEPPDAAEATMVSVAPKGKKPGLVTVNTVEISADVKAIDYQKRTVTLQGPQGNLATYKVGPSVKRFNAVKKGDQVVLRVTEALAIVVTKP